MEKKDIIITVAQDGQGDYATIGEAIIAAKAYEGTPLTIKINKGTYKERLEITQDKITLLGEDKEHTIITYDRYALFLMENGEKRGTFRTQTVFIDASDFTAQNLTFANTAGFGPKIGQALALYVDGDRMSFINCRILGGQDTLFTAPLPPIAVEKNGFRGPKEFAPRLMGRHYYKDCFLCGDVDFIFGGATAYFEGCEIFSNNIGKDINGYVTAASTPEGETYGYVFNQCRFTSNCPPNSVYLGRPWRDFAKVVILNSEIGAHILPQGWHDWGKVHAQETVFYAEYKNIGKGANTDQRVPWAKVLSDEEALNYMKEKVLGVW